MSSRGPRQRRPSARTCPTRSRLQCADHERNGRPPRPRLACDLRDELLGRNAKPSAILKYLDQYVVGQEDAKKIVAVAVYSHYRKIANARARPTPIVKSNVLLIGSSGTGKTLLCETLSRLLDVPFVTAEATSLAQTRFVNEEIEAMLQRLVDKAGGDVGKAEHGIVFIDEIDKLKAAEAQPQGSSGESVQHALLKIMEGAPVKLGDAAATSTRPTSCSSAAAPSSASTRSSVADARLRLHRHVEERQPAHPRPAQHAREAHRPVHVRADPRIHRPAADHRALPATSTARCWCAS